MPGAIELTTGRWVYRLGRRCAADFTALLQMLAEAFPRAPVIVVICDNDSIHHARKVTAYLKQHPRLELLADPLLLPQPVTGSDAGHRRALDQSLAAAGLRAELLECRLTSDQSGQLRPINQHAAV